MKKLLFLVAALTALFALSCDSDNNMPCLTCILQEEGEGKKIKEYCGYYAYDYPYCEKYDYEDCSASNGTFYGSDSTCGGMFGYCSFDNRCEYGTAKDCSDNNGTLYGSDSTCGGMFGYCSFDNRCEYGTVKDCSDNDGTFYDSDNTCGGKFGFCKLDYFYPCSYGTVNDCSGNDGTFYGSDETCGGTFGSCGYYRDNIFECERGIDAYNCVGEGFLFYGGFECVGNALPVDIPKYQTLDGCPDASTTPVNAAGVGSVSCGGETYKTVKIGEQVWMARNLNYNANGSRCYGDDTGGDSQNKCGTYGRLYDWATAMGIASYYNIEYYHPSESIMYQGVCPQGWHLPSNAEWGKLMRYVDGRSGEDPYTSPTAGRYLKASDGWYNDSSDEYANRPDFGNGEDTYGFAALPGGGYYPSDGFIDIGKSGVWWSASENASGIIIPYTVGYMLSSTGKGNYNLFSVRCIKN